ncbi:MAG: DUF368 domain-containing protein [Planctomycetota bacterium]
MTNNDQQPEAITPGDSTDSVSTGLLIRGGFGGVLMGLANLVPGISGGTMLLAAGIYPRFIAAVAQVTRLKLKPLAPVVLLGTVAFAAAAAIVLLAGPVKNLVVDYRWVMYSAFIGLTLGGLPLVWKMAKPIDLRVWLGAIVGFAGMAALALLQQRGSVGGPDNAGFLMLMVGGIAGASAMILPGVSGGYLLLVLGLYVPILGAIDEAKAAVTARDLAALMGPALSVFLPVGLGVIVGIAGVSNLLGYLLRAHEKATLGVLVGLLLGAVVGLYPFQQGVMPEVGTTFKGEVVTVESQSEIAAEDYPTELFAPRPIQAAASLGLVVAGIGVTLVIARFGREKDAAKQQASG